MRVKVVALGFLVVALLTAMTGVGHAARQEGEGTIFSPASTPISGVNCGGNIDIFTDAGIKMPEGVSNVFACGNFDGTLLSGSTITMIAPDTTITQLDPDPTSGEHVGHIRQKGTAYLTILQGELTVVLLSHCAAAPDCTNREAGSLAEVTTVDQGNNASTVVIDLDQEPQPPVTVTPDGQRLVKLTAGQNITLTNVTVMYTSGKDGALVAANGSYNFNGGEGCVTRCWQFT